MAPFDSLDSAVRVLELAEACLIGLEIGFALKTLVVSEIIAVWIGASFGGGVEGVAGNAGEAVSVCQIIRIRAES